MEEATSVVSNYGLTGFQLELETLAPARLYLLGSLNICDHLAFSLCNKKVITENCAQEITQDWLPNTERVGLLLAELQKSDEAKLTLFWKELYYASSEEYRNIAKFLHTVQEDRHEMRRQVEKRAAFWANLPSGNEPELSRSPAAKRRPGTTGTDTTVAEGANQDGGQGDDRQEDEMLPAAQEDQLSGNEPELSRWPAAKDNSTETVVAEGASQGNGQADKDLWTDDAFMEEYFRLIRGMDPQTARSFAYQKKLITSTFRDRLLRLQDPATHNEILLAHLEAFGSRTFVGFVEILKAMGSNFAPIHAKLAALLRSRSNHHDDHPGLNGILSRECGTPIPQVSGAKCAEQGLSGLFPDPTKGERLAIAFLEHTATSSSSKAWKCAIIRPLKADDSVQPASSLDRSSHSVHTLYAEDPDEQTRCDEMEDKLLAFFNQERERNLIPKSNGPSDRSTPVVIYLPESLSKFKERCDSFRHTLAGLLQVERDQVSIRDWQEGSVILLLVIPMEAMTRLILLAMLQPYKLSALGITEVLCGYGTTITTSLPRDWAPSTTSANSALPPEMDVTKSDWWKETVDSGTVDDDASEPFLTRAYRVAKAFVASKGGDEWLMESFAQISSSTRRQRGMPVSDAYSRALRTRGAVRTPQLRLVAYGDTGVGKTALCNALRNRPHQTKSPSTDCVDFSSAAYLASVDGHWRSVDDSGTLARHVVQMIFKEAKQDSSGASSSDDVATSDANQTTTSSSHHAGARTRRSLPPALHPPDQETNPHIEEVVELVSSVTYADDLEKDVVQEEFTLIRICDLTGQDPYRTLQDVLISPVCTAYLTVFDASRPVTSPSQLPVMRRKGRAHSVATPTEGPQSRLDYLIDCLGKLHSVVDPTKCTVYCVGTKIDQRQGSPQEVALSLEEDRVIIEKRLRNSVHPDLVKKVIFVDNTRENTIHQSSLQALRRSILHDASTLVEIPLPWLLFTLAAEEIAKHIALPWITLAEAEQLALRLGCIDEADDLSDLLEYQHALGHVLFFADAPDHVIVKPDLTMRCIATLIVPDGLEALDYFPDDDSPSNDDVNLYRRGILTEAVAEKMWKHCPDAEVRALVSSASVREAIFDLMKVMSILCHVGEQVNPESSSSERIMLIPSVAEIPEKEIAVVPDDESELSPQIAVIMPRQRTMPLSSMVKLATKCMSRYDVLSGSKWHLRSLQMGKTAFRIPWADHSSCLTVLSLRYIRCGVLLEMVSISRNHTEVTRRKGLEDARDAVIFVQSTLCDLLKSPNLQPDLQLAAICCCGSSEQATCTPHQESDCRLEGCFHLTTAISKGERTSCPSTARVQDVDSTAFHWLNLQQNDAGLLMEFPLVECAPGDVESLPTELEQGSIDPWESADWPPIYSNLVESMDPATVRTCCFGRGLLSVADRQVLLGCAGSILHNEKLLDLLRPGGRKTFKEFLLVLREMGSRFERIRTDMAHWPG